MRTSAYSHSPAALPHGAEQRRFCDCEARGAALMKHRPHEMPLLVEVTQKALAERS